MTPKTIEQAAADIRRLDDSGNFIHWKLAIEDRDALRERMIDEGWSPGEADARLKELIDD